MASAAFLTSDTRSQFASPSSLLKISAAVNLSPEALSCHRCTIAAVPANAPVFSCPAVGPFWRTYQPQTSKEVVAALTYACLANTLAMDEGDRIGHAGSSKVE